jgi:hypothetical protein
VVSFISEEDNLQQYLVSGFIMHKQQIKTSCLMATNFISVLSHFKAKQQPYIYSSGWL